MGARVFWGICGSYFCVAVKLTRQRIVIGRVAVNEILGLSLDYRTTASAKPS
jgi:hypothetical protein